MGYDSSMRRHIELDVNCLRGEQLFFDLCKNITAIAGPFNPRNVRAAIGLRRSLLTGCNSLSWRRSSTTNARRVLYAL
jgi:hypothetical protein